MGKKEDVLAVEPTADPALQFQEFPPEIKIMLEKIGTKKMNSIVDMWDTVEAMIKKIRRGIKTASFEKNSETFSNLKKLAVTMAIIVDKAQLVSGAPTTRLEVKEKSPLPVLDRMNLYAQLNKEKAS